MKGGEGGGGGRVAYPPVPQGSSANCVETASAFLVRLIASQVWEEQLEKWFRGDGCAPATPRQCRLGRCQPSTHLPLPPPLPPPLPVNYRRLDMAALPVLRLSLSTETKRRVTVERTLHVNDPSWSIKTTKNKFKQNLTGVKILHNFIRLCRS